MASVEPDSVKNVDVDVHMQGQNVYAFVGDIPAGQTVTIIYDVIVANGANANANQVVSQGTVSGSNFVPLITDDPDTSEEDDETKVPITSDPVLSATKTDY